MAVEEVDQGTFACTRHDYEAEEAAMGPSGAGETMASTGPEYLHGCPARREARCLATEEAPGGRLLEQ